MMAPKVWRCRIMPDNLGKATNTSFDTQIKRGA